MLDNLEYTFFNRQFADKFATQCQEIGLAVSIRQDASPTGEDLFELAILDPLTDEQAEQVEGWYGDILFGEQAAQIEGNEGEGAVADACGVQVQLQSGTFTTVAIHPTIMNKILSVLSIDELQKFLAQVAEDIENPKQGPICRREDLPEL